MNSPLRFPGGKSRIARRIAAMLPADTTNYYEPMVGGGSVLLAVLDTFPQLRQVAAADIDCGLINFWKRLRLGADSLVRELAQMKFAYGDRGKELFTELRTTRGVWTPEAVYFALNRMTFSGLGDAGGYSAAAFHSRFTNSAIHRLREIDRSNVLFNVEFYCANFANTTFYPQQGDWVMYLDPPYYANRDSRLYGKRGMVHAQFDHVALSWYLRQIRPGWRFLMTYDDTPAIRELYDWAIIEEYDLQYGMNNIGGRAAAKGKEIFISNYREVS